MHSFKWLVAVELYIGSAIASTAGHSNLAIVAAIAAIVATLVALEPGAAAADDDDEPRMTVERLALVLVYAWQLTPDGRRRTTRNYIAYCRHAAIGLYGDGRADVSGATVKP